MMFHSKTQTIETDGEYDNEYDMSFDDSSTASTAYMVQVKKCPHVPSQSWIRIKLSSRLFKVIFYSLTIASIVFAINYLGNQNCLEQFQRYQCNTAGKYSKRCNELLQCLKQKDHQDSGSSLSYMFLLASLLLIFFYYTTDKRNPLIRMKVNKTNIAQTKVRID